MAGHLYLVTCDRPEHTTCCLMWASDSDAAIDLFDRQEVMAGHGPINRDTTICQDAPTRKEASR